VAPFVVADEEKAAGKVRGDGVPNPQVGAQGVEKDERQALSNALRPVM
jgi:hypothetical protein